MIATLNPFIFRTLPPTYSWDLGIPGTGPGGFDEFVTGYAENSAVSLDNEEGIEYVGYAPYVFVSLSSYPGDVAEGHQAIRRFVNFGDYYNPYTNEINTASLNFEVFSHVYVMPGLYTITFSRTEYTHAYVYAANAYGGCLQKHGLNWTYKTLNDCSEFNPNRVSWASTKPGQKYEKRWKYEVVEDMGKYSQGLFVQETGVRRLNPLSWRWSEYMSQSDNPQNNPLEWNSTTFQEEGALTWANTTGPCLVLPPRDRTVWKWDNIIKEPNNVAFFKKSVTWDDAAKGKKNEFTWDDTLPTCDLSRMMILSGGVQNIVKTAFVRVLEIPPKAFVEAIHEPERLSPLKVRLSPRHTVCGSFPIDKIVWDLGDGSPLLTQRRWANTLEPPFVYNGLFSEDYQDPRNFDIEHTYYISSSSTRTFYPSLTAYASSTSTSDSAATTVGPLRKKQITAQEFKLIQNELTNYGKVLLGEIEGVVGVWRSDLNIEYPISITYLYPHVGYYSADEELLKGKSKLFKGKFSNSEPAQYLSGNADIDKDGNLDFWFTSKGGIVDWNMILINPYNYGTEFYGKDLSAVQGMTVMHDGQGTAAVIVKNLSGTNVDIDKDGRLDNWYTDNYGRISWYPAVVHPYRLESYYLNSVPIQGQTKVYSGQYSDATVITRAEGINDVDNDGHLDNWNTDYYGNLYWSKIIQHPYPNLSYWTDTPQMTSLSTILWSNQGTGAVRVSSLSGSGVDLDNDGNLDTWTTDTSGVISWSMTITHPYVQFEEYYSDTLSLTSGISKLYETRGSGSNVVFTETGTGTVNNELNLVSWTTNEYGIVTWFTLTSHPWLWNGYYLDVQKPINNVSILWNNFGSAATAVTGVSGTTNIEGDNVIENWYTDQQGIIKWTPQLRVGKYWYSTYSTDWYSLSNWYSDLTFMRNSDVLPLSSSDVIILSSYAQPFVDIDNDKWTEPASIDASLAGITLYSNTNKTITCDITGSINGVVLLSGNIVYGT